MRIAVVIGNPKPGSRTLSAALAVADATQAALRISGRLVLDLAHYDSPPLTRRPGGVQAYKMLVPPGEAAPELQSHEGYEWMYVLAGRLRLGELDLKAGEVAEFDTHTPAAVPPGAR